ncbi:tetratricopeptide repeat protein [Polyangium jinanense]|uniref:Tetratricopeptide repeat protein n=1 Tax=Polyangium jinanense TaxID=2829994 RepID=A0A9X3XG49_9BACT|nr:tetratricopeptide repeat protein [Polyangium jinanense]MDC3962671.1 tetratricopeptide repeat protein [Polyangium jinanense]MDC3989397.1 tetratricopeptide repeat protein [Polyangium jinanense]
MSFEPEALLGEDDGLVLRRFFEWGVGHGFDLAIVQITTPWKRDALIAWAKANVQGVAVIDLREVGPDKRRLWDVLREATAQELGATSLILHGLEEAEAEERIVAQLNVERDELARSFPLPWLLLVHPTAAQVLEQKAPDFVDFAGAWMWEEKPEPLRLELAAIDARHAVAAPLAARVIDAGKELLVEAQRAIQFGAVDEAADLLARFDLKHPEAREEDPDRISLEGAKLAVQGRLDDARAALEAALGRYDARSDRMGRAAVAHQLAIIDEQAGRYDAARAWLRESITINAALGNRRWQAGSLHELATLEWRQGRHDVARTLLREALEVFDEFGDRAGRAACLHLLAVIDESEGRYEEARALLGEAIDINKSLGNVVGRAASLLQLGCIELKLGRYDEAQGLFSESSALAKTTGSRALYASALHHLAIAKVKLVRYEDVRTLLAESMTIRADIGDQAGLAASQITVGQLEVVEGRLHEGRRMVLAAIQILEAIGSGQVEEARAVLRKIDALRHPPTPS